MSILMAIQIALAVYKAFKPEAPPEQVKAELLPIIHANVDDSIKPAVSSTLDEVLGKQGLGSAGAF